MHWNLQSSLVPSSNQELISLVLANRNINQPQDFLTPINPKELSPIDVGLDSTQLPILFTRLKEAREEKQVIVIYGDYDCDGVCATAILWETLFDLGFKVIPFIPHREKHGYGLSAKGLEEVFETCKPEILISVDNGIVAHAQWKTLKERGVYTVLTDHHQPEEHKPTVDVLLHSTQLCGATVSWMVAREIERHFSSSTNYTQELLDLCAVATIADQVPLTGANRSFAKYGLEQLNHTNRLGLLKLIESANLRLGEIDTYSVNFGIAPRINAMGRLEHALDALRALCTRRADRAIELISKLSDVNQTRQDLTQELIEKALLRALEWKDEHIIIIEDTEFHEGVIGLISSKLTEKYYKPSICISKGTKTSKASCRSIPGVNITDLLRQVSDDLLEVGGHPMAAGFKVETEKIPLIYKKLCQLAREQIPSNLLQPKIDIDCELSASLQTIEVAQALEELAPFGTGNREPLFLLKNMQVLQTSTVGKEGKHLKVSLLPKEGKPNQVINGIGFGMGQRIGDLTPQSVASFVGSLQVNEWTGRQSVQILIKNIKPE